MTSEDIDKTSNFIDSHHDDVIIKAVGVGGGGDNAVNHMYEQGIDKVSFVVCNTDKQALDNSPVPNRLLIGPTTTKGRGAGNKPELAREAAEESAEDIDALFDDGTQMVFITAGMGGGTGTGAAPVVARIARERGLLTVGIVTIPFLFEGQKKILKALDGAEELSKYVDSLLVVNNEQLTEIYPDLDWVNAFAKADDTLSNAARSISELITCSGHINLDFMDVDRTLRDGGAAIISTGYGEGENRVSKAIEDALNSPLLKNRDILGSKHLLFNLYFSRQADIPFKMGEANQLTNFISQIDPEVDVIYGIAFDDTLGNKIKFTILASGFDVSVDSGGSTIKIIPGREQEQRKELDSGIDNRIAQMYGKDKVEDFTRRQETQNYYVLTPEQLDDDAAIEMVERSPAFRRDKRRSGVPLAGKPEEPRGAEQPTKNTDSANQIFFSADDR